MKQIRCFFLPLLLFILVIPPAGAQTRWTVVPDSAAIVWSVRPGDSHRDHIEMSGLKISAVLRYGVDSDGCFRLDRSLVWPMLRTVPNNTHASLMRHFGLDIPRMISVNEQLLQQSGFAGSCLTVRCASKAIGRSCAIGSCARVSFR